MFPPFRVRLWKLTLYQYPQSSHRLRSTLLSPIIRSFSSMENDGGVRESARGRERVTITSPENSSDGAFEHKNLPPNHDSVDHDGYSYRDRDRRRMYNNIGQREIPPEPIPNRPLRGDRDGKGYGPRRGERNTGDRPSSYRGGRDFSPFDESFDDGKNEKDYKGRRFSHHSIGSQKQQQGNDFLEKFRLGFDKDDSKQGASPSSLSGNQEETQQTAEQQSPSPPEGADEIFKKMKETGLIPNAVAMLDGLFKDGLVKEAMNLFSLMREKGTIPEVVIYTAVVEGFCKALKLDDAIRIFRKMQGNGITPNAFSYTVLVQGLTKGKRLEDAFDFCVEMLKAGHSPNLATFVGLVDEFCYEKSLEEGKTVISKLKENGFVCNEKAVREFLDKKGPSKPLVWEAFFGKNSSSRRGSWSIF